MPIITKGLSDIAASYKKAAQQLRIAEARAIKRAGVSVRTAQAREIGNVLNLRQSTIRDEIRTRREPTTGDLSVTHQVRARGVPLKEFIGARQTRKGVAVRVTKTAPRAVLGAAFGLSKKGGHYFGRAGKGSKKYGSPHVGRTPIVKLYGPNVLSQYIKEAIAQKGADVWQTRIAIELERETAQALKRAGVIK